MPIDQGNIYAGLNNGGGGGTVTTNNGISGTGTVLDPVILGGNPLIQSTVIDNANNFNMLIGDATQTGEFIELAPGVVIGFASGNVAEIALIPQGGGGHISALLQGTDGLGGSQSIIVDDAAGLMVVTDTVNHKGLEGLEDFSPNYTATSYVQEAWVSANFAPIGSGGAPQVVKSNFAGGQTTTQDLAVFTNTFGTQIMVRVSTWAGGRPTSTGQVLIKVLVSADEVGNAQSYTQCTASFTGSSINEQMVISYIAVGATVTIHADVSGTIIYDATWCIERLPLGI